MVEDRTYLIDNIISFYKTDEKYGLLSNMKGKLSININGLLFYSSEAVYQSLKYPNFHLIQQKISSERSPIIAKRISKKYSEKTRDDWEENKNNIMRLTLIIKSLHCTEFYNLLRSTNEDIVEISKRDDYWGAIKISDKEIKGKNVLGRLLMELRDDIIQKRIIEHLKYIIKKTNNLIINKEKVTYENIVQHSNKII
jgi:ribA/ribD-fused uncharacterized protein